MNHAEGVVPAATTLGRVAAAFLLGGTMLAQGSISGSVQEGASRRGVQGVIITVRTADTHLLTAMSTTDASGDYRVAVPAAGIYTLQAARLGYRDTASEAVAVPGAGPGPKVDFSLNMEAWAPAGAAPAQPARRWGEGASKSFLVPALEIPTFLVLLNLYDRHAYPDQVQDGKKVYSSTFRSTWDHIRKEHWVIDEDPFAVNQFMHPYQGAMFHGFARSAGLNYWQATLYDNLGSYAWKMGGETDPPSINDQIATGIAGSFFGEALFRMASLLFEEDESSPSFLRKLGGILVSPSAGFNRYAFGDRFRPIFPSNDPALFTWLQLGEGLQSSQNDQGVTSTTNRNQAMGTFSLAYGLPGKDGYTYTRPFDYFQFEFDLLANNENRVANVMLRGLLFGTDYEWGESFDGIWGFYGGYDYISPYIFRVSSTAVLLGSTFQARLSNRVTLQGSLLGGVGYAAAGNTTPVGQRDYHYGLAPQGLGALRLIFGRRAMLDLTHRWYYVSGNGSDNVGGNETINRLNASFTVRLFGHQAIGVQYIASNRKAHFPGVPDSYQAVGTVAVVYTLLGKTGFGAVK